ncbi:MAG: DUF411 domain-containing protein [Alphaproteobacteria bacterium]|nr:DUF411 domain-containing protein [Alphaproteobacteria bacterium]
MTVNKFQRISGSCAALAVVIAFAASLGTPSASAEAAEITVYKSPSCGCCKKWVSHMEKNGHSVKTLNFEDMDPIKKMAAIPEKFQSCHTAIVDGYVVEGHVPAKDVERLLKERPKARGIAVPGMPAGSPGMEQGEAERYEVLLFNTDGSSTIYSKH